MLVLFFFLFFFFGGGGGVGTRESRFFSRRKISEFQEMWSLVFSTLQILKRSFPITKMKKTLFKTLRWKEKVLMKICMPLKWRLES